MPELSFKDRKLVYAEFGAGRRLKNAPTVLVPATEYRDTESLEPFYSQFPETMDIVVLDNTNLGQATRTGEPIPLEEVREEVRFVKDALGIDRMVLVGYCATAELALYCARELDAAGVILQSPLVRRPDGNFVEYFYSTLKKAILDADTLMLSAVMNILDPHARGFREDRAWAMSQHFANQAVLNDNEHFWVKTLQCKPTGKFQWDDLPSLDCPVRIIKGADDTLQPNGWVQERLTRPDHDMIQLDSSHQILNEALDDVIVHMSEFCEKLSKQPEKAVLAEASS